MHGEFRPAFQMKLFVGVSSVGIADTDIRREFGVKRIIEADVSIFKRNDADGTSYCVSYRNKTYRLR